MRREGRMGKEIAIYRMIKAYRKVVVRVVGNRNTARDIARNWIETRSGKVKQDKICSTRLGMTAVYLNTGALLRIPAVLQGE
jgi:hypothetical protein